MRIKKSPARLQRRPSGYYWRQKIRTDLQPVLGKAELRRALGTSDLAEARHTSAILSAVTNQVISMSNGLTDDQMRDLLECKLTEALEDSEFARLSSRRPMTGEQLDDHQEALSFLLSDTREALATNDYRLARRDVDEMLREAGIELQADSESYQKMCREFLKMRARYLETEERRAVGREDHSSVTSGVARGAARSATSSSMTLQQAVERYVAEHTRPGQEMWTAKTRAENEAIFDLFLRILGKNLPIMETSRSVINEYRETLMQLPPNLNKSAKYRDKSIADVLAIKGIAPMATNTVNKNLTRVASLFRWAYRHGHVTVNPAESLTVRNSKRADEERPAFPDEELQRLFAPRKIRHPYQHWLPLLGLYTGARLEEICQAHLDDFKEVEGVMVLHICPGENKKLKSKSANRMVPLHSALLKAGLLEYIEEKRKEGSARLFPELSRGRDGYGQTASKWFSRLRRQVGVEGVFHSFRHTVATRLKEVDVPEHAIAQIMGHEHSQISTGRYGKRHEPKKLQQWIELIDFSTS